MKRKRKEELRYVRGMDIQSNEPDCTPEYEPEECGIVACNVLKLVLYLRSEPLVRYE